MKLRYSTVNRIFSYYMTLGLLLLSASLFAQSEVEGLSEQQSEEQSEEQVDQPFISQGGVIEVDDFSIAAPQGWEVIQGYPGLSLLMQIPRPENQYQRTIQVMKFHEPVVIDETTAAEYEETIKAQFSKLMLDDNAQYQITQRKIFKLADGSDAILYYSSFKLEEKDMMHAHILASSANEHYLITYTDLAEHFVGEQTEQYLNVAWTSMTSLKLPSSPPSRYGVLIQLTLILSLVTLLLVSWSKMRKKREQNNFDSDEAIDTMETNAATEDDFRAENLSVEDFDVEFKNSNLSSI